MPGAHVVGRSEKRERERESAFSGICDHGLSTYFFDTMVQWKILAAKEPVRKGEFFSTASVSTAEYICPWCTCRGSHWIERDWGRWGATMVCSGGVSQPYAQFAQDKPIFETRNYCMCPARQGKVRLNQPFAHFTPNSGTLVYTGHGQLYAQYSQFGHFFKMPFFEASLWWAVVPLSMLMLMLRSHQQRTFEEKSRS